jgi:OOP family OmpA-OmpF porin
MCRNQRARWCGALLALLFTTTGFAQETGFYVGGSIGQAKAKDLCDAPAPFVVTSCDEKATGWKAFAGYRFHRHFAIEGTYIGTDHFSVGATFLGVPVSVKADAQSLGIAALGIAPIGDRFSLFGKLGILRTEAEAAASVLGQRRTLGDKGTGAHYGVGAIYHLTRNWGLRGEWERARKGDFDLLTIGVQYGF